MPFSRSGTHLYLHWRVLKVSAAQASNCEREFRTNLRTVVFPGGRFRVLADGHALLEALSQRSGSSSADVIPWTVDAALLPKDRIDWDAWAGLAATYGSIAVRRISELRLLGVEVPVLREPKGVAARLSLVLRAWAGRALRTLNRGAME